MMSKRHFVVEPTLNSPSCFEWELCLYCQKNTAEKVQCPGTLTRKGYSAEVEYNKLAANIQRFKELDCLLVKLSLQDNDKETLAALLTMNKGKFHMSCKKQI